MVELQDAADRDHDAGRHSGGHRPRLVGQLHDGAAQGALRAPAAPAASRASWPSWPARSRSTGWASRSASRISTSRRTAASPASRSSRTTRVEAEPLDDRRWTRCFDLEDNLLLFFTGFSRSAGGILADQKTRTRAGTTRTMLDESALRQGARPAQPRGARSAATRARSAS